MLKTAIVLSALHRTVQNALKRLCTRLGRKRDVWLGPLKRIDAAMLARYEELRRDDPAAARRMRRAIHIMADYQAQKRAGGVRAKP